MFQKVKTKQILKVLETGRTADSWDNRRIRQRNPDEDAPRV